MEHQPLEVREPERAVSLLKLYAALQFTLRDLQFWGDSACFSMTVGGPYIFINSLHLSQLGHAPRSSRQGIESCYVTHQK